MSSLSAKQVISLVALVAGVGVFAICLAQLTDFNSLPSTATEVLDETRACLRTATTDAEVRACANRTAAEPWYEQHPVLSSLAAGLVTFFTLAAGGRLFLR